MSPGHVTQRSGPSASAFAAVSGGTVTMSRVPPRVERPSRTAEPRYVVVATEAATPLASSGSLVRQRHVLGANRERRGTADGLLTRPLEARALERTGRADGAMADVLDRQEIDLAEELGDEAARRALVDVPRRRDLQHLAVVEDRDARRERQSFALVMGHENEGGSEFLMQPLHLVLHLTAQMFVQRRKRLIEQENGRLEDQRAGQRDALLLPARQFRRQLVFVSAEADALDHFGDAPSDGLARDFPDRSGKPMFCSTVICGNKA